MRASTTKTPNPMKAAIIGCGRIAGGYDGFEDSLNVRTHAKAYHLNPHTALIAVVDPDYEKADAFSNLWQVNRTYTDVSKMLATELPEIVSICTPDDTHQSILDACLKSESLRAVWCEKPLCTDYQAARGIVSEYENKGIILAVNYQRRWASHIQKIKHAIRHNRLGSVQKVVIWYNKGILHNGSHAIDLILDWFGLPKHIDVLGRQADYFEMDPTVDAQMVFDDFRVYLLGTRAKYFSIFEIDIMGSVARAICSNSGIEWFGVENDSVTPGYRVLRSEGRIPAVQSDSMSRVLKNITDSLIDGREVFSTGSTALDTLRVCDEIIKKSMALEKCR